MPESRVRRLSEIDLAMVQIAKWQEWLRAQPKAAHNLYRLLGELEQRAVILSAEFESLESTARQWWDQAEPERTHLHSHG